MPYKSQAQVGFLHANHPRIAARWDKKYGVKKDLPEHARLDAYDRAAKRLEDKR